MTKLKEPPPLWPEAHRHCPDRPLPAYRFVPGLNPHPTGNEEGHSYGIEEPPLEHIPTSRWPENEFYLYGVDLYHQGYFWEAHEAWESLWHLTAKRDAEGQYLQGLIQNAAAQLKLHLNNYQGGDHLAREAYRRLSIVAECDELDAKGRFMGLPIHSFLRGMAHHYNPLWDQQERVEAPPPHIILSR